MSDTHETLTELQDGISQENKRAIVDTFESEAALDEYIHQEREKRERERQRRLKKELENARENEQEQLQNAEETAKQNFNDDYNDDFDAELARDTARVKRVSPHRNSFRITLTTREGNTFTEKLDFALPEDTGSDWVKLCNWCDTNPERPTELRGEIVPTTIAENRCDRELDIPPLDAGLNPVAYKSRRLLTRAVTSSTGQKILDPVVRSTPWWGTALWFAISSVALLGLMSLAPIEGLTAVLSLVPIVLVSISFVLSAFFTLKYWGWELFLRLLDYFIIPIAQTTHQGLSRIWRFLFPTDNPDT